MLYRSTSIYPGHSLVVRGLSCRTRTEPKTRITTRCRDRGRGTPPGGKPSRLTHSELRAQPQSELNLKDLFLCTQTPASCTLPCPPHPGAQAPALPGTHSPEPCPLRLCPCPRVPHTRQPRYPRTQAPASQAPSVPVWGLPHRLGYAHPTTGGQAHSGPLRGQ